MNYREFDGILKELFEMVERTKDEIIVELHPSQIYKDVSYRVSVDGYRHDGYMWRGLSDEIYIK